MIPKSPATSFVRSISVTPFGLDNVNSVKKLPDSGSMMTTFPPGNPEYKISSIIRIGD